MKVAVAVIGYVGLSIATLLSQHRPIMTVRRISLIHLQ